MSQENHTPAVRTEEPERAVATRQSASVAAPLGAFVNYESSMSLAKAFVDSGFLPASIKKPAQALAIMQMGAELGIPPMRALTGIFPIEGRPTVGAVLLLERFKERGGSVQWHESGLERAAATFTGPDGSKHREEFTIAEAQMAGLVRDGSNWKKHPRKMLRARVITGALRAMGESGTCYIAEERGVETDESGAISRDRSGAAIINRADAVDAEFVESSETRPPATQTPPAARSEGSGPQRTPEVIALLDRARAAKTALVAELPGGDDAFDSWLAARRPGGFAKREEIPSCVDAGRISALLTAIEERIAEIEVQNATARG